MDGKIGVESSAGKGSLFWFSLNLRPVMQKPLDAAPSRHHRKERRGPSRIAAKASILIVDDDTTNRFILETVFRKNNVYIISAKNGREAVKLCASRAFDLIFMDCQMPIMDGFTATAKIRALTNFSSEKRPLIIALTADATQSTRRRCTEVGMDDYLIKPLDFEHLQDVIDKWLPDSALHITTTLAEPEPQYKNRQKKVEMASGPINHNIFNKLKQNIGDIRPVIWVFLNALPGRLNELNNAIEKNESEIVRRVAHTLRGTSSQFGAARLAELCQRVENKGKTGNLVDMGSLYDEIKAEVQRVVDFLTEQLEKK